MPRPFELPRDSLSEQSTPQVPLHAIALQGAFASALARVEREHPRQPVDQALRIARQHAEALLAHFAHVNALVPVDGLGGESFDRAVESLAVDIVAEIQILTARW